jgi:hypothetical protein
VIKLFVLRRVDMGAPFPLLGYGNDCVGHRRLPP